MMVLDIANSIFDGVPADERDRTTVRNYRDLLAVTSAPSRPALSAGNA